MSDLEETIGKLKAEIEELKNGDGIISYEGRHVIQLRIDRSELQSKLTKAVGALEDYGKHSDDCPCFQDNVDHASDCANCECGLKQILVEVKGK